MAEQRDPGGDVGHGPVGQQPRGRMQGGASPGEAWLLAATAGGLLSAVLGMAGLLGLPGGPLLLWLAPLPLFVAGLGFGPLAALAACGVGGLAVTAAAGGAAALIFLLLLAMPVPVLVGAAWRRDRSVPHRIGNKQAGNQQAGNWLAGVRLELGPALVALGLWPVLLLLLTAWRVSGLPGGLDGLLHGLVQISLAQMAENGADAAMLAQPGMAGLLHRIVPAALGLWLAVVLALNGRAARAVLRGRLLAPGGVSGGLTVPIVPPWQNTRLPFWYLILPAVAAGFWLSGAGPESVRASALLLLLVPVFGQGIIGVHARLRGRSVLPLVLFYLLLVVFNAPAMLAVTALGLHDQWWRRAAPADRR